MALPVIITMNGDAGAHHVAHAPAIVPGHRPLALMGHVTRRLIARAPFVMLRFAAMFESVLPGIFLVAAGVVVAVAVIAALRISAAVIAHRPGCGVVGPVRGWPAEFFSH